jgi:hypothetical protein
MVLYENYHTILGATNTERLENFIDFTVLVCSTALPSQEFSEFPLTVQDLFTVYAQFEIKVALVFLQEASTQ